MVIQPKQEQIKTNRNEILNEYDNITSDKYEISSIFNTFL